MCAGPSPNSSQQSPHLSDSLTAGQARRALHKNWFPHSGEKDSFASRKTAISGFSSWVFEHIPQHTQNVQIFYPPNCDKHNMEHLRDCASGRGENAVWENARPDAPEFGG